MSYSENLPKNAPYGIQCTHLDSKGERCENKAKHEYYVFLDPKLGGGWYLVYVCNSHLAEVMHVSAIEGAGEDEHWLTPRRETPRTFA